MNYQKKLYEISQLKEELYIDLLKKLDINNLLPVHINILQTINNIKDKPFIVNVAKQLYKSKADTSSVISTLLKKEYITSEVFPSDKRAKILSLTIKGQDILTKIINIDKKLNEILVNNFNSTDKRLINEYLSIIKENLENYKKCKMAGCHEVTVTMDPPKLYGSIIIESNK